MQLTFPRLRAATFTALVAGLFATFSAPTPAQAQQGTAQVDVRIANCEERQRGNGHTALAYSKMGVSYCARGGSLRTAKRNAKKECKQLVPRNMRKKAPCEILATDLEIVEPYLLDVLRQEVRIPVNLEIYDGDTEQTQRMSATLIYGDAVGRDFRRIDIVGAGGQELCNGRYEITRRKFRFEIRCFGTYRFKNQKSRVEGYFLYNGIWAPVFETKLKRNASYIQITPPASTN